jgi:hypothetical protein
MTRTEYSTNNNAVTSNHINETIPDLAIIMKLSKFITPLSYVNARKACRRLLNDSFAPRFLSFASLLFIPAFGLIGKESFASETFLPAMKEHYESVHQRLASACVEYSTWPGTKRAIQGHEWYSIVVAYEPGRQFTETYHFGDNPLISAPGSGSVDPLHNIIYRDAAVAFQLYPESGMATIDKYVPSFLRATTFNTYFSCVGFPNPEGREFLDQLPRDISLARKELYGEYYEFCLPYALRDPNWSPTGVDVVDGTECKTLKRQLPNGGSDTLWVEEKKGFPIRRRQFESGEQKITCRFTDFVMYDDDIAIPTIAYFALPTYVQETRYKVNRLVLGTPDPDLYTFRYPEGTLISDNRRADGKIFVIPGGKDILVRYVGMIERYMPLAYLEKSKLNLSDFLQRWLVPLIPSVLLAAWFISTLRNRPACAADSVPSVAGKLDTIRRVNPTSESESASREGEE